MSIEQRDEDTVVVTMTRKEARETASTVEGHAHFDALYERLIVASKSNTYSTAKTQARIITTNRSKLALKGDLVIDTTFVIPASESTKEGDLRGIVNRVLLMARVDAKE